MNPNLAEDKDGLGSRSHQMNFFVLGLLCTTRLSAVPPQRHLMVKTHYSVKVVIVTAILEHSSTKKSHNFIPSLQPKHHHMVRHSRTLCNKRRGWTVFHKWHKIHEHQVKQIGHTYYTVILPFLVVKGIQKVTRPQLLKASEQTPRTADELKGAHSM